MYSYFGHLKRRDIRRALKRADTKIFESAIQFLSDDPKTFGTGYIKEMVWRYITRYELREEDVERLQQAALKYLEHPMTPEFRRMCQAITRIADEQFWVQVGELRDSENPRVQINAYCLHAYADGIYAGEQKRLELKGLKWRIRMIALDKDRGRYMDHHINRWDQWETYLQQREKQPRRRDIAMAYMREGFSLRLPDYRRLLQIMIIPSFAPCESYELCIHIQRIRDKSAFVLLKTSWRIDLEAERFDFKVLERDLYYTPMFDFNMVEVEGAVAEAILHALQSQQMPISFNLVQGSGIGVDGTSYELAIGDIMSIVRYHWWEKPPAEWQPLHEVVMKILDEFRIILSEARSGSQRANEI